MESILLTAVERQERSWVFLLARELITFAEIEETVRSVLVSRAKNNDKNTVNLTHG